MAGPSCASGAGPWVRRAPAGLARWLHQESLSILATTYQRDLLLVLGAPAPDRLEASARRFDRPMGLSVSSGSLRLATRCHIHAWSREGRRGGGSVLRHRSSLRTGYLDAHDLAGDGGPDALVVDTRHSCLRRVGRRALPVWQPPFVSSLAGEDRCHLNGLAAEGGRPVLATALAASDAREGWRGKAMGGGILLDVEGGRILADGLCLPHSPRIRDGRIWLLNGGRGELGTADFAGGGFRPRVALPGLARGLAFHREHAIVGLSRPRPGRRLDLPSDRPEQASLCGLAVVDLRVPALRWLAELGGGLEEIYDVQALCHPGEDFGRFLCRR